VFTHIKIEYQVTGHGVEERAVRRAIELSARRYCPVQAMLGQVVPIELEYQIFEAGENGKNKLVTSGEIRTDQ
jgi:putative redox protein